MKIGILGTGHIGKTLVLKLGAAGHEIKVANSRGPETIPPDVLAGGACAVSAGDAVSDVDVAILSVPLIKLREIAPLLGRLRDDAVLIDTSNYYPQRDGHIASIDAGLPESRWVVETLGRPVVKAWNAIGSDSFARLGKPAGSPGRIAVPVAADDQQHREVGLALVEETGFDGLDAGRLADSWRQQPGTPAYCTDLLLDELSAALLAAEAERSPKRRDLAYAAVVERMTGSGARDPGAEYLVSLNRLLFM